jgi:hypothetical protein
MADYWWDTLLRALRLLPASLGSNWLGLLFPLFIPVIAEIIAFWRYGWRAMIASWVIPTKIALASALIAYGLLLSWCILRVVYQHHEDLTSRLRGLQRQFDASNQSSMAIKIKGWIDNQDQNQNAIIQVWLSVDNSGQLETLRDWELAVKVGNVLREGRHSIGQAALLSSLNIPFLDTEFQRPVGVVADMQGYVTFGIKGMNQAEFDSLYLDHSATLIVSAIDSKGRRITAEKNIYETWLEGHERRPAR